MLALTRAKEIFNDALGWVGTFVRTMGWVCALISVVMPHVGARAFSPSNALEYGGTLLLSAAIGIAVGMVCHAVGANLYGYSLRRRAPNALRVLAADQRRPVLYLRPFQEDLDQARSSRAAQLVPAPVLGFTAEQAISDVLRVLGPVVAIGRPGEALPPAGFARMYVADDRWQGAVLALLSRAAVIVLVAGNSPGLLWEIQRTFQSGDVSRLLIVIPAWKSFDFEAFRRVFQHSSGLSIPDLSTADRRVWPLEVRALLTFKAGPMVVLHEYPTAVLPEALDPLVRLLYRWYQCRGIVAYPPWEVQGRGLLLDALQPILNRYGLQGNDPRIPYLKPKADGKWVRRAKTAWLIFAGLFIGLVLIGGIWAFWTTGIP